MTKRSTSPTVKGNRKLTSAEYRVLAEHAESQETEQRTQDRKNRVKRAAGMPERQWATAHQVTIANQEEAAARKQHHGDGGRPSSEQLAEKTRQQKIRDRNRSRRLPWYGPLAALAAGMLGHGVVSLFDYLGNASGLIPAAVVAAIPAMAGIGLATNRARRKWIPELLAGGVFCGGLTFWTSLAGLNWPIVLVMLLGTLALGWRQWKTHPVGPGVPPLEAPRVQRAAPEPATPTPAREDYTVMWDIYNANHKRGGKAPGSRLANRRDSEHVTTFDVELARGVQTPHTLRTNQAELASGLAIRAPQLLIEDDPHERGEHVAQVTIVRNDPVANIRYYTAPTVTATATDGIVHSSGRYGDGRGELDLIMWNDAGMVPTAIIGATRSGKSSVGNIAVDGLLATTVMNLLYIDPKGVSSPDLADVARIAILGPENAARAPELVNAILAARRTYGSQHRISKFNPTPELPGWCLLHDEFSELVNRGYRTQALAWTSLVNTVAAMGMWPVAMNQAMQEGKWGDDQCRSAFASQMVVMRMRTFSGKLIPGLELHPSNLPHRKGVGVYVYDDAARSNVPVQFDYLPEAKDAENHVDAPVSTTTAFARHDQPDMLDVDYQAIVSVLGPPNADGRWVVGGAFGTHTFPAPNTTDTAASPNAGSGKSRGGWGAQFAHATPSTESQRHVFGLIAAGTVERKAVVAACRDRMSEATIDRALDALVAEGRIYRPEGRRGEYAVADSAPEQE